MADIVSVRIENYKSIVDTEWVDIHPETTVLIGPNEAGKTNFLEALGKFPPGKTIRSRDLSEYITEEGEQTPDCRISIEVEDLQVDVTASIGQRRYREIAGEFSGIIHKYRGGTYEFVAKNDISPLADYQSSRNQFIDRLIAKWSERFRETPDLPTIPGRRLQATGADRDTDEKYELLMRTFENVQDTLNQQEELDDDLDHQLSQIESDLTKLRNMEPIGKVLAKQAFNPIFYREFDSVPDRVAYSDLSSSQGKYRTILNFIGIPPDELQEMPSPERRERIQRGIKRFEEIFNNYWPGDDIGFNLDLVGENIELLVSDSWGTEQFLSQRSQGFQHFLSFVIEYVQYSGMTENMVLVDDPDLHLHPEAQKEFRAALNNIAEEQQMIYSTHSPYMVDKSELSMLRLVEKDDESKGTEIVANFSLSDRIKDDVLSPIRASLGATFADSLFASKHTILVEGYTDRVYINRIDKYIKKQNGESALDYDVTILDVGSASNLLKYARLLESEGYEYAIFADTDNAGRRAVEKIKSSETVSEDKIVTPSDILVDEYGNEEDKEIEDLFAPEFYSEQVADCYNIEIDEVHDALNGPESPPEESIKGLFKCLQNKEERELEPFDKSNVADAIDEGIYSGNVNVDDNTLGNFIELFAEFNDAMNS